LVPKFEGALLFQIIWTIAGGKADVATELPASASRFVEAKTKARCMSIRRGATIAVSSAIRAEAPDQECLAFYRRLDPLTWG
jgi:hypothetical protein